MSALNLTTTGVVAYCTTRNTFPAGFPIEGFADGDALSVASAQIADMIIGVDGQAGVYTFPSPKQLTVTLLPSSVAAKNFLLLASAMEKGGFFNDRLDEVSISVALPAQGMSVTFTGGIMTECPPMPNVKQRLENVQFVFKFEKAEYTALPVNF